MKAIIVENSDIEFRNATELTGNTIVTIALGPKGITGNISGYVTKELLGAIRKEMPKVIDELTKKYEKENNK